MVLLDICNNTLPAFSGQGFLWFLLKKVNKRFGSGWAHSKWGHSVMFVLQCWASVGFKRKLIEHSVVSRPEDHEVWKKSFRERRGTTEEKKKKDRGRTKTSNIELIGVLVEFERRGSGRETGGRLIGGKGA